MSESKELLEAAIKGLEEKLSSVTNDLNVKNKELQLINKPTISEDIYKLLQGVIREAIDNTEFSCDDFDVELRMDYDNKVEVDNLNFNSHSDMYDDIIKYIDREFRVVENEEKYICED